MGAFQSSAAAVTIGASADPRSPTHAFARTPLAVARAYRAARATFDPRSPTVGIARTPLAAPIGGDPRSPTFGVARTPLAALPAPADPRSPTAGIARTPLPADTRARAPVRRRLVLDANDEPTVEAPVEAVAQVVVDDSEWAIVAVPPLTLWADDEAYESADDEWAHDSDDDDEQFFDSFESAYDMPSEVDDATETDVFDPFDEDALEAALDAAFARKQATAAVSHELQFHTPLRKAPRTIAAKFGSPRTPQVHRLAELGLRRHALSCPSSPAA